MFWIDKWQIDVYFLKRHVCGDIIKDKDCEYLMLLIHYNANIRDIDDFLALILSCTQSPFIMHLC